MWRMLIIIVPHVAIHKCLIAISKMAVCCHYFDNLVNTHAYNFYALESTNFSAFCRIIYIFIIKD
uniref:Secreted protein n=1 Tax=Heterorhabditis bacteriophora TaxID=37862 RepID=A0A1I7WQQ1_HETBA